MKKIYNVLPVILTILILAGCQSTPEDPVVIQKDMEQMIEKAQATDSVSETPGITLAERLGVPERFTADESYTDGRLTLSADAQIVLPKVDTMPVVRVMPEDFSQELVDKLYDYLIGETPMYQQQAIPTKEKIQENIVGCQEILSDPNSSQESKLQAEEHKAELEAAYPTAPDSIDLVAANAKIGAQVEYHPGTGEKMSEYIGVNVAQVPGLNVFEGKSFYIKNNHKDGEIIIEENVGGWTVTDTESQGARFYYKNYDLAHDAFCVTAETVQPDALTRRPESITDFTYEDAIAMTNDFLLAVGIDDMQVRTIALELVLPDQYETMLYGRDVTPAERESMNADIKNGKYDGDAQDVCFKLELERTIDGIAVTSNGSSSYIGDAMFGAQWFYEEFTIEVCRNGISSVAWRSPHRVTETVTEKSSMLSFNEIADVFHKMYRVKYDASGNSLAGEVTRVVLSLRRVMDQNNLGYGLFVPVWDFYGTMVVSYPEEPSHVRMSDESLLTINAIDGSVVDLDKGY
jgi:hypothetical protein